MPENKNFLQELHDLPHTKRPRSQLVSHCTFKRAEDSKWEGGVAVGPDEGEVHIIVTYTGETIPAPIYDYRRDLTRGCLWIHP